MDTRIKELVEFVKEKYGLTRYKLARYELHRSVNFLYETEYGLDMEWFPEGAEELEDGSNPDGTIVIDLDIGRRQVRHFICVGEDAAGGPRLTDTDPDGIARWLEEETGLIRGQQFELESFEEGKARFRGIVHGVPVSPAAVMTVEWNDAAVLKLFTKDGYFPSPNEVEKEEFQLDRERLADVAMQQVKMIDMPDDEQKKTRPLYGIEEVYVMNDLSATLPVNWREGPPLVELDELLTWQEPLNRKYENEKLQWDEQLTPDQAFAGEASPDAARLTEAEIEKCKNVVIDFLRSIYPQDSGNWRLMQLWRKRGKVRAILSEPSEEDRYFEKRLAIMLDGADFRVLTHGDNYPFVEEREQYNRPGLTVSKQQAFEKLRPHLTVKPYYRYDDGQKKFRLCGMLDCDYFVDAVTGELFHANEL
ncbi:hypothetical protein [Planomicrobium sp. YIM 101495]|uniref:hypothetical protein n=1 Tax=Planomicrobium sp. YIM 101495 TaxID=2665160 RepID=UPI0012B7D655|nr:hypothetical protein [Planomicrobium sp. YIM 101495]MTD32067.1 hypothetical protein [Planomicrobium sp. YIM 101495]